MQLIKWITGVIGIWLMFSFSPVKMSGILSFPQDTDTVGLPSQNLELHAAMGAFQQSQSVEGFEQTINSPAAAINNLDLNHDGLVDYIRVVDHSENGHHAIALRAVVSEKEEQDVASILIEKTDKGEVHAQLVGEPAIYGKNVIIEPAARAENRNYLAAAQENVSDWACIKHMYATEYKPWVSPYKWGVYPENWKPRNIIAVAKYRAQVQQYRNRFLQTTTHKLGRARKIYNRHRIVAPSVIRNKAIRTKDKVREKIKNPIKY